MRMYKIPRWYRILWVVIELVLLALVYIVTVLWFLLFLATPPPEKGDKGEKSPIPQPIPVLITLLDTEAGPSLSGVEPTQAIFPKTINRSRSRC